MSSQPSDLPLSPEQRAELEALLQQRRQTLDGQLAEQLAGQTRAEAARELLLQDGDDAPQRDADREVALARTDHEMDELGRISQALLRVQAPDFGCCIDCGGAIGLGRLRAAPWATRCVACEGAHETGASGPGPR